MKTDTLVECNPIQFYSLNSSYVDILTVSLSQWNNVIPSFHVDRPVIVTLLFKKKLKESQRKYIRLDEPSDRE